MRTHARGRHPAFHQFVADPSHPAHRQTGSQCWNQSRAGREQERPDHGQQHGGREHQTGPAKTGSVLIGGHTLERQAR